LEVLLSVGADIARLGPKQGRDHRAKFGEASGRGDNASLFIFLLAALGGRFRWASYVPFLALAAATKKLTKNREN
jgi:hypothetical protein